MSINELAKLCNKEARDLGWYEPGHTKSPTETLMMVVTELAEAVEELRQPAITLLNYDSAGKPIGLQPEIADAVIRLLDFAADRGIDLEARIMEKLKYNRTRGERHGKQF